MPSAILSLHFQIQLNISQCQVFPAKPQALASKLAQNHDRKIKPRCSKLASGYTTRRKVRKFRHPPEDRDILSERKLIYYLNSGCLQDALQLFETMRKSRSFIWNLIIRGLVDSGFFQEAIKLYFRMQFEGIQEDYFTFPFVIKACAAFYGLKEGRKVHSRIVKLGLDTDVYICNALIIMYAKVGTIEDSEKVFNCMPVKDLVSWNSMISGYVSAGDGLNSLMCFKEMQFCGIGSDRFSVIGALSACALTRSLLSGKEILCHVLRMGLEFDAMVQSSVIDMFGKCGEVTYAENFFNIISQKNVVVWNVMIGACGMNDESLIGLSYFKKLRDDENVRSDFITFINILPSCSKLGELACGEAIHCEAIKKGFLPHLVLETALIDMYGKCGSLTQAKDLFLDMKEKNLISWNSMVAAYVQNSHHKEAIVEFQNLLQYDSYVPDAITFASILPAYAEIALPKEGKQIHGLVSKSGISLDTFISNALIHMYAKCGDLKTAREVFDSMSFKDVVSWNTIIMAFASHGFTTISLNLFSEMVNEGYEPNQSTFVSVLSSCSISGNVGEGWKIFNSMKMGYGVDPGVEHYGCMLDLLGRVGDLTRAKEFIDELPFEPTSRIWGSLLAASRHHKDIEMAELAAERILELDNDNTGCYVLLANMYAEVERWDDVARIRDLMKKRGIERIHGCTVVEGNGVIYNFSNYDRSKIVSNVVFHVLDIISREIGEGMDVNGVCRFKPMVVLKKREKSPMYHSVRLAVCFGLISTAVGEAVLVRKNVRICEDCHNTMKKISEVTNREIVVGDCKIHHHFKNGRCSCGDYW